MPTFEIKTIEEAQIERTYRVSADDILLAIQLAVGGQILFEDEETPVTTKVLWVRAAEVKDETSDPE